MVLYFSQSFSHQASNHTKIYKSNIYILISGSKSYSENSIKKFKNKEKVDLNMKNNA